VGGKEAEKRLQTSGHPWLGPHCPNLTYLRKAKREEQIGSAVCRAWESTRRHAGVEAGRSPSVPEAGGRSPLFGTWTGAVTTPRNIQLAARFSF